MVSTAELVEAGVAAKRIHHLASIGHLHQVFRSVWAVGRPELSFLGWCRAAWLASGPGSAVSHISAARVHQVRSSNGRIHVSIPRGRRGHPGLHVHRPRSLPLADIVERHGFAVTSLARTLLDMAPRTPIEVVGRWIHEAGVQQVLDLREIHAVLRRHPHHRGARILEAALAVEVEPTRSELEALLLAIWRSTGLPRARANRFVWSGERLEEVDLYCDELDFVVEVDGANVHWSRWRRRRDAEKDERMRRQGRLVLRVPEVDVRFDAEGVAARMLATARLGRPAFPDGDRR